MVDAASVRCTKGGAKSTRQTHDGTTSGITDHEYLAGFQLVNVCQVRAMHCRRLGFAVTRRFGSDWARGIEKKRT